MPDTETEPIEAVAPIAPVAPSVPKAPDAPGNESDTAAQVSIDRDEAISKSEKLAGQGDFDAASEHLHELLLVDNQDTEVIFRLAGMRAAKGRLDEAVDLLDSIPTDDPIAGYPALGQSADYCLKLGRYGEAERRYKRIVRMYPDAAVAHRKLAFLYNCQGRRHEAAYHLQSLCMQGNVRQDELHALIHLSHAMTDGDAPGGEQIIETNDNDPNYIPIGDSAQARMLFTAERYQEAVDLLRQSIANGEQPNSIKAFYGRAAAEAQDHRQLQQWLKNPSRDLEQYSEYWAAIGLWLIAENRYEEAARSLMEAIDRDPTDYRSISRLRSVLETLGDDETAAKWDERAVTLKTVFTQNNQVADAGEAGGEAIENLAESLSSLGRNVEAVLWRSIAAYHRQASNDEMQQLRQALRQTVQSRQAFPDQQARLCGLSLESYPLPNLNLPGSETNLALEHADSNAVQRTDSFVPAAFENLADAIGLKHSYQVASEPRERGFTVYQSVGGAVAVLDFDRDGIADLYLAQGAADPPDFVSRESNVLYRSNDGSITEVTNSAHAELYRYSTGVTAGDWNQDGFDDLFVANIGENAILINNGDGTFTKQAFDDRDDKTLMTTSLAVADLDGDSLPDLFELNYLHDSRITDRPKTNARGQVIEPLMPQQYQPGLDRIAVNQPDGQPSFQDMGTPSESARAGLGVIVGDFDHQRGNEVFVGNDVYANQLWVKDSQGIWADMAMLHGCAYGFSGAKTASMGIASGDFDRNGWLDFHITNFQRENVSYYLNHSGRFKDRNIQYGLSEPSSSVLGFGTQSIDYDNDSDLDLVVANGHIEDAIANHAPFQQPMQLFANRRDRFELADVDDKSGYWSQSHLGRGLAKLDWNRDGKTDFVVTHLGEQTALLVNRCTDANHWLQVSLAGVDCERAAIGARVTASVNGNRLTEWVTAGDGFFSRNEPIVSFGLAAESVVSELTIDWPGGARQTFSNVAADQHILVVEGTEDPFSF
ncbi:FG-GAP-like repeat-containing protein [Stieleria sp. JC731]|uniref:FG-GAP-like repeat-containing protein n=1 Tax=Pirellulaceae TaxID=2691357 RepID=UPI001E5144A9|nr:FG-GAP-like repeat-containing protein [Stieleria sp. JC731]MCC9602495.1 FG-GAP-like repeat-containing protein [Stieleria sp. JC731]